MRKSRTEAAETKDRIVATATRLFLVRGLDAVGMRDIMAAAGLTPGAFYRHFESKEQLIAAANSAAFDRLLDMLEAEAAGRPPKAAAERIISVYLGQSQGKNSPFLCPLSMLGAELSHCNAPVRAIAVDGYRRLVQLLADRLPHRRPAEALARASGMVSTMVGAVTLAGMAPDPANAGAILRNAHALLREQIAAVASPPRHKPIAERRRRTRVPSQM